MVNVKVIDVKLFFFIKSKPQTENIAMQRITTRRRQINRVRHHQESQKRISAMIILNGLNFLLLRTPSLASSFYGFIYRYDSETKQHYTDLYSYYVCRSLRFCNALSDTFFLFYLISILVQFFIFYKLDKNFKKSFLLLYNQFKERIRLNV